MDLENKIAIVTGGLSGIGRAIVSLFAQHGARVVVFDYRDVSRDDGLSGEHYVAGLPIPGVYVQGDVADPSAVKDLFEQAVHQFGRVDLLVNCAGITAFKPIRDLTVDDFDRVMAVNVRGSFLCCKEAIALMQHQEHRGVIVNVASNFAFVGAPDASVYCASKGAIVSMTKALSLETGPVGIRVNALCPGATATEFNRQYRADLAVRSRWEDMTPLRMPHREEFLGSPSQIAESALFLASNARSGYMTGASLVVDGGWNAG